MRVEKDDAEAEKIHGVVKETYGALGYELTLVPLFEKTLEKSLQKRFDFILEQIRRDMHGKRF